jgi:hypothetical protein
MKRGNYKMKKLTLSNAQQIAQYFTTFYKTNGKPLRDNPARYDEMQKRMYNMLNNAVQRVNATFEYGTHISKNDTMTYVIIAKQKQPTFIDRPYVVYTYNAEHDGLYNGYYDIEHYDDAKQIMENRK